MPLSIADPAAVGHQLASSSSGSWTTLGAGSSRGTRYAASHACSFLALLPGHPFARNRRSPGSRPALCAWGCRSTRYAASCSGALLALLPGHLTTRSRSSPLLRPRLVDHRQADCCGHEQCLVHCRPPGEDTSVDARTSCRSNGTWRSLFPSRPWWTLAFGQANAHPAPGRDIGAPQQQNRRCTGLLAAFAAAYAFSTRRSRSSRSSAFW
jgi:hypothetical protein